MMVVSDGVTCPKCREVDKLSPVIQKWDHRGTESYLKASCPECGWESSYGPI